MRRFVATAVCGVGGLLACAGPARAVLVPFTEDFTTGTSNWLNNANAAPTAVATGGPNGATDAFVTTPLVMDVPGSFKVVFRGNSSANASNGAFAGNWVSAGVTQFTTFVRQDSGVAMTFGGRFAPSSGAGIVITSDSPVPSGVWTKLTFDINASNPNAQNEGPPLTPAIFNSVFSNIGNVQVFANQGTVPNPTTVNFSLDKPSTVPEPAALGLLGVGALGLLRRRRAGRG